MSKVSVRDRIIKGKNTKILPTVLNNKEFNHQQTCVTDLSKEIDMTYTHTTNILHKLELENIIRYEISGRMKIIILTEKGHKLAKEFDNLLKILR